MKKIDFTYDGNTPSYLREAWNRYEKAFQQVRKARAAYDADVQESGWLMNGYEQARLEERMVGGAMAELRAAVHSFLVCKADARGSDLYEGCFP